MGAAAASQGLSPAAANGQHPLAAANARKLAASTRAPMACRECRESKHKCDGQPPADLLNAPRPTSRVDATSPSAAHGKPAEVPCTRCSNNDLPCLWLPKAKLGRPAKRSPSSSNSNSNSTSNSTSPATSSDYTTATAADQHARAYTTPSILSVSSNASPSMPVVLSPSAPLVEPLLLNSALAQSEPPPRGAHLRTRSIVVGDPASDDVGLDPRLAGYIEQAMQQQHQQQHQHQHQQQAQVPAHGYNRHRNGHPLVAVPLRGQEARYIGPMRSQSHGREARSYRYAPIPDPVARASTYPNLAPATYSVPIHMNLARGSGLRMGVDLYFTKAPRYCLALTPSQRGRLDAELDRWADVIPKTPRQQLPRRVSDLLTLAHTAAAISWKLTEHPNSRAHHEVFLAQARIGLSDITSRVVPTGAQGASLVAEVTVMLQALLLGCTLEYGLSDLERAGVHLKKAVSISHALNLNLFDSARDQSRSDATNVAYESAWLSAAQIQGTKGEYLADDLRRCFWELCVIQTMYYSSTSGQTSECILRSGLELRVNFPENQVSTEESDYGLRICAATLLLESVQPCDRGTQAKQDRFGFFNSKLSSLLAVALQRFMTGETEQTLEITYTAYLMLSSARIQLTRLTCFPDLTYGYRSCSFGVRGVADRTDGHEESEREAGLGSSAESALASALALDGFAPHDHPRHRGGGVSPHAHGLARGLGHHVADVLPPTATADVYHATRGPSSAHPYGKLGTIRGLDTDFSKRVLRRAVAVILQAADNIMEMTRMDMEPEHRRSRGFTEAWDQPFNPVLSHSPFHGCTQVNASFGYVIACTLWSELTEDPARLGQSPQGAFAAAAAGDHIAAAVFTGGGGDHATTAGAAPALLGLASTLDLDLASSGATEMSPRRMILKNLARAHDNLLSGSLVWPMIAKLTAEVGLCRELVDSTEDRLP